MDKLDSFSKILLATGTINYLAAAINSVNEEMKFAPDHERYHVSGIERRDAALLTASVKLSEIMNALGGVLDEVCAIDEYVTTPAFEVLVHGKDDVNGEFQ